MFAKTFQVAVVSLVLASCNYYQPKGLQGAPGTGVTIPGPASKATFASMTATFFKPYCLRCHKGNTPGGDINLETYQGMIDLDVLVPGKPEDSMIYTDAFDRTMPKRPPMPSDADIETLRVWIADGALEK